MSIHKVEGYEEDDGEQLTPAEASQSSTHKNYEAAMCIDGRDDGKEIVKKNPDQCSTLVPESKKADPAPWLAIDYGEDAMVAVGKVVLANRLECCFERAANIEVRLTNELPADGASMFEGGKLLGSYEGPGAKGEKIEIESEDGWEGFVGRYLLVQSDKADKPDALNLKEVTAFVRKVESV